MSEECALWYMRYGRTDYELCDTEEEAAYFALSGENAGEHSVLGVQFADGRLVTFGDWEAYKRVKDEEEQLWEEEANSLKNEPPTPTRTIRVPFRAYKEIEILATEPGWLGLAPHSPEGDA